MTWRTVVVTNKAKLSYKNDYLIVRNDEVKLIHLSEINTLIIDTTAATMTSYLISEMLSRKIKIIICDKKRNPQGEIVPYYGSHNTSEQIFKQIEWDDYCKTIWTRIIEEKIINQANYLKELEIDSYKMLYDYVGDLVLFDETNREGHAAKVYFNCLFGKSFSREDSNDINYSLNYGYTILLSQFNKEIVSQGYLTQIGIKHHNVYNWFNLSSDLMEPFRPLIDKIVKENFNERFDGGMKVKLADVLNHKVRIKGKDQYVSNAISIYVKSVFNSIEKKDVDLLTFFEYEL
nr:type II CRISPR-associated endonuclease Cas1 [uncultured Faecalibacillus sp.]